jgi:hypothetical protein
VTTTTDTGDDDDWLTVADDADATLRLYAAAAAVFSDSSPVARSSDIPNPNDSRPLLFVLNHCITLRALLDEACIPDPIPISVRDSLLNVGAVDVFAVIDSVAVMTPN